MFHKTVCLSVCVSIEQKMSVPEVEEVEEVEEDQEDEEAGLVILGLTRIPQSIKPATRTPHLGSKKFSPIPRPENKKVGVGVVTG